VNAHFDYFPTIGALLGRRAADQDVRRGLSPSRELVRANAFGTMALRSGPILEAAAAGARRRALVRCSPQRARTSRPERARCTSRRSGSSCRIRDCPSIELLHGSPGVAAGLDAGQFRGSHGRHVRRRATTVRTDPRHAGRERREWWHDSECVEWSMGNAEAVHSRFDVRGRSCTRSTRAPTEPRGQSPDSPKAAHVRCRSDYDIQICSPRFGDFSGDDHPWTHSGMRVPVLGHHIRAACGGERTYDPRVLLRHWHHTIGAIDRVCVGKERPHTGS
jgi:hypothetical protein